MKKGKGKILILVPSESSQGGIINYYTSLKNHLPSNVEYFIRGARKWPDRDSYFKELLRAFRDLRRFKKKIVTGDYCLVHANTSLGAFGIIRDAFFIRAANKEKIKAIVFLRGWDIHFERRLERFYLFFFRWAFFKSDAFIVLASSFRNKLIEWGYRSNVYVESTVVDALQSEYLTESELKQKLLKQRNKLNILFLARIKKTKGIYTAIDAFNLIRNNHPGIKLTIAGDGSELESAKAYAIRINSDSIMFTGKVEGELKSKTYKEADLYIFPSESEGMPNSVLEAMAFGLPVVASPVGGLIDILVDGKTGYFASGNNPEEYAKHLEKLIIDEELRKNISLYNFKIAREKYTASQVALRLNRIYSEVLANQVY